MNYLSNRRVEKLSWYVQINNVKRFIKTLKKYKIDIVNDDDDCILLCTACRYGSYLIVRFMLEKGVDVKKVPFHEKSALYLACEYVQTNLTSNVYNDLILPLLHAWPESVDNINTISKLTPRQLLQRMKNTQKSSSSEETYSDDSYISLKRKTREDTSDEEKYDQINYEKKWREKLNDEILFDDQNYQQYNDYEQDLEDEKNQCWDDWASQIEREYNAKRKTKQQFSTNYSRTKRNIEKDKVKNINIKDKEKYYNAGTYTPRISRPLLQETITQIDDNTKKHYNNKCNDIFNSTNTDNNTSIVKNKFLSFSDIPWPANASLDVIKLKNFFCVTDNIDINCLKKERIRWHPDRFKHRTMDRLKESDKNIILKHVNELSQVINQLINSISK